MHFLFCGVTQNKQSKLFGCQTNNWTISVVMLDYFINNELCLSKKNWDILTLGDRGRGIL